MARCPPRWPNPESGIWLRQWEHGMAGTPSRWLLARWYASLLAAHRLTVLVNEYRKALGPRVVWLSGWQMLSSVGVLGLTRHTLEFAALSSPFFSFNGLDLGCYTQIGSIALFCSPSFLSCSSSSSCSRRDFDSSRCPFSGGVRRLRPSCLAHRGSAVFEGPRPRPL